MSLQHKLFAGVLALAGWLSATNNTKAQDFQMAVTASPNPVQISNTLTYTLYVTNTSGFQMVNVFVTNTFSAAVIVIGKSGTIAQQGVTNGNELVFPINIFPAGYVEQLGITLLPGAAGALTNQITVLALGRPTVTTNFVTQVSTPSADLALTLTNVASGIFAGDTTTIGLTVTNRGPNSAAGIILSNTLPASFDLLSVSPTNASYTFTNGNLAWNIGSLLSGGATQMLVSVRPTSGGTFSLAARVTASTTDTNAANNAVTNSMTVDAILSTNLTVTVLVPQQFNPQTGLMEELVRVTNVGTNDVPSVRLIVSGLSTNRLYNAVGTNNGNPYVTYAATLATNQFVDLLLEYFVRSRTALTNLTRTAIGVSLASVTVPTNAAPNIISQQLTAGGFMIEFQSIPGRSYTILYADNMSFTNALAAQPAVVAPADRVQWIDNGPPKTVSTPANVNARFYRVVLNP
jgi:uncharacterized repeat protein (TIGR01451 family)